MRRRGGGAEQLGAARARGPMGPAREKRALGARDGAGAAGGSYGALATIVRTERCRSGQGGSADGRRPGRVGARCRRCRSWMDLRPARRHHSRSRRDRDRMIRTARLDLVLAKEKQLRAELESRAALAAALACEVPDGWPPEFYDAEAVHYSLNWLLKHPSDAEWGFYYFLERATGVRPVLIGAGGFKGAPDADGLVELGYSIVPERRRRGYATEAVRGMLTFAFADSRVRTVIGQTLPSLPASI